jgi:hypothetical protein
VSIEIRHCGPRVYGFGACRRAKGSSHRERGLH